MGEKLDDFVNQLQARIYEEAKDALGEKGFDRWMNPRHRGVLKDADAVARLTGSCGDTMQIYLKFKHETVSEASYESDGCGVSTVCASLAAELAIGKNPDEILGITGDTIRALLGKLPEEEQHCADLAAETLQAALNAYMMRSVSQKGPAD